MDYKPNLENPERLQLLKQFDAGQYLKHLRGKRTLATVCKELGVSTAYLSDVERGKMPSDRFIEVLANFYEINEDELFNLWGKTPILAKDEILNNRTLQRTLREINRNTKLTDAKKEELYDEIYKTYERFAKKIAQEKEDEGEV
ncbi:MAG: helix-turn-helix transcriptional regulator [Desulfosporosinus sp.]|nr:helix-turn-helix transcriptional regulator [Desulfosporosinus sp.]